MKSYEFEILVLFEVLFSSFEDETYGWWYVIALFLREFI